MKATELWHNPSNTWFEQTTLNPQNGFVQVEALYSMISQGTEKRMIGSGLHESTEENMRVPYMKGNFGRSFTYGYSLVGKVRHAESHQYVHLMHPHQDLISVRKEDLVVLPDGFDPKLGTLISNMETAVNAVWDACVEVGDKVLIFGFGTIGALTASIIHSIPGITLHIAEQQDYRVDKASSMGLAASTAIPLAEYDIVINATGKGEVLQEAFTRVRKEGKVVELSWLGRQPVQLNLGDDFHYKRIQLISSQVSHIPDRKRPVWDYTRRKGLVIKLLKEINPIALIEKEVNYQDSPAFYHALRKKNPSEIGIILKY